MKAEGNVVEWDRARLCKGTVMIFLPILSLWPFVVDILNPRGFPMEPLADFSFQILSYSSPWDLAYLASYPQQMSGLHPGI